MSSDRTVLEHLLDGRDALVLEVKRLTTAIEELDSVIARIGGQQTPAPAPAPAQPVNPPAEVEAPKPVTRPRKAAAKKAPARRRPATAVAGDSPKSIRVHVLEMLGEQDRDYGLAEIIDRIHGLGIQAHDDAVRSITIKLMKDGKVERIGRGQYRLARRAGRSEGHAAPQARTVPQADTASQANTSQADAAPQQQDAYVPPLDFDQNPSV